MKEHLVTRLRTTNDITPPKPSEILSNIDARIADGWDFKQMSSGGVNGGENYGTWVYLIFERDK